MWRGVENKSVSQSLTPLCYWATRPCAVSVEECSLGRRVGNAGLEMDNIYTVHTCRHLLLDIMEKECTVFGY
jgi:hypothetical protein